MTCPLSLTYSPFPSPSPDSLLLSAFLLFLPPSLKALVQKGERRHLFVDTMPAVIQHKVNEDNLQYMRHRDVYCTEYFEFVRDLAYANHVSVM